MIKKIGSVIAVVLVAIIVIGLTLYFAGVIEPVKNESASKQTDKLQTVRYGISPFQDTAMPVVAKDLGLYRKAGLNVKLITVAWENITSSVASAGETVDVAIGSINLLLPRAENINVRGGGDVVFYYPFYVFKGGSLMMHANSKMHPLTYFLQLYPDDRKRAVTETMEQLRGKRVGLPQGTPYEQMLLAALKIAGMNAKTDIDLRYVKLKDGLPAFLANDIDVVGAGVTQRTEAMRHGAKVFMDMESFGFAEIVGLVTTGRYAKANPQVLNKLVKIWFQSVDVLFSDIDRYSKSVLDYLKSRASTRYTLKEYKTALGFQEFPRSINAANKLLMTEGGKFYWKRTWDIVNDYLVHSGKISAPIPYKYFWGDRVQSEPKQSRG